MNTTVMKNWFMKNSPYLAVTFLFLILFCGSFWYLFDGPTFHFHNYFFGSFSNLIDLARVGSVIFSEWWEILYLKLGGSSFFISRQFFVFGYCIHMFYPLFFLSYVARKDPENSRWAGEAMWMYVLSLFIIRGFGVFFLVSEIFAAHTVAWLSLFSYVAGPRDRKFHIFIAIFSVFTYPIALFTNGVILIRHYMQTKKISAIHLILIAGVFALHLLYESERPEFEIFLLKIMNSFRENTTSQFYLVFLLVLFGTKKFFRYQFMVIGFFAVLYYWVFEWVAFWQSYPGRGFALLFVIPLQMLYGLVPMERYFDWLVPRAKVFTVATLLVICFQALKLEKRFQTLKAFLHTQNKAVPYYEAIALKNPNMYLNGYTVRMYTLSMGLMQSNHVQSWIDPDVKHGLDLICKWGPEKFLHQMKLKGLTVSDTVIPKCNFPKPFPRRF
ncbi:MAG: hypothetical protein ACJ76H_16830 [Bacteriovoracaceae bacterium]